MIGGTTPHIKSSFIGDRNVRLLNVNLDYVFPITLYMADRRDDTQHRHNLVGNIFQQLMQMRNTNVRHIIVNANIYLSTLRISEAAHPL